MGEKHDHRRFTILVLLCALQICDVVDGVREASRLDTGRDRQQLSGINPYYVWQANRFNTRVEWGGGRTNCSEASQCYDHEFNNYTTPNETFYFENGFSLSDKDDGLWKNGTKLFENQVHTNPDDEFSYLVVAFNLTLYGRFECQFVNSSLIIHEAANDSNVFFIGIQDEWRGFPLQVRSRRIP